MSHTSSSQGKVWLVGAGPGDPDLLTQRAVRALGVADLVLYDALVDARALALASRAQRFPVGKRGGRPSFEQGTINRLMATAAKQGRQVVRLKAGDPFVFGRGGEEALHLLAAGCDVEVVPGLSTALCAPAAAGIPVTHRGMAQGVLVLTGSPATTWRAVLSSLPAHSVTLVVMMGISAREDIAAHLLAHGWHPHTPAALVFSASTADQYVWRGDLARLTGDSDDGDGRPGVLIVGAVASLGATLCAAMAPTSSSPIPTPCVSNFPHTAVHAPLP